MIASSRLGDLLGNPNFPNIGDASGARIQYQRMLDIAESLVAADPANKTAKMDLTQAHLRMGTLITADEPGAALAHLRQALDLIVQLAGADPNTLILQDNRGIVESEIGAILASQGQLAEGIVRMRRSIAIAHTVLDRRPKSIDALVEVLGPAADLAPALARSHDRASVDALVAEMSSFLERLHTARAANFVAARRPRTLFAFGTAYSILRMRPQACAWFRQSVDAWSEIEASSGIFRGYRPLQAEAVREDASCEAENSSGAPRLVAPLLK
jgi:hypothetical protein